MALKQIFTNNAVSLLSRGIGSTETQLTVLTGHGELFPTPQTNEFFTVTLENEAATVREIIHVLERNGDTFTVLRGQEGTTAREWGASAGGDTLVDHRLTALTLSRLSNTYENPGFPALTNFSEAIDYLIQGGPTSGQQEVDAPITMEVVAEETIISTPSAYRPGTTSIYIGGSRQKRGVDFIETGPTELRLQFRLSQEQIDEGQNVVVDYVVA